MVLVPACEALCNVRGWSRYRRAAATHLPLVMAAHPVLRRKGCFARWVVF